MKNVYRALKPFVHENMHVDAGAQVSMTEKQATFLLTGGFVEPLSPPKAEAKAETRRAVKSQEGDK